MVEAITAYCYPRVLLALAVLLGLLACTAPQVRLTSASADISRQVLYAKDGWAANEGGADAMPEHVNDANQPLGGTDCRDPLFDFEAYLQVHVPAIQGKKPHSGALEEARQHSASNQAACIIIRIPFNTTSVDAGAHVQVIGEGFIWKSGAECCVA